jgi:hypothetical protein
MLIDMPFSYNWNNKLNCNAFTTIRILNVEKHSAGNEVNITLKGNHIAKGRIEAVTPFFLDQMSPFVAYLDTGYSVDECKSLIRKMYPKIDFNVKRLCLILIVKNK